MEYKARRIYRRCATLALKQLQSIQSLRDRPIKATETLKHETTWRCLPEFHRRSQTVWATTHLFDAGRRWLQRCIYRCGFRLFFVRTVYLQTKWCCYSNGVCPSVRHARAGTNHQPISVEFFFPDTKLVDKILTETTPAVLPDTDVEDKIGDFRPASHYVSEMRHSPTACYFATPTEVLCQVECYHFESPWVIPEYPLW